MKKYDKTISEIIGSYLEETQINWQALLSEVISHFDCTTGTIHLLEPGTTLLKLQAQQGIPEFLLPRVTEIPIGKGMAGIAAERRKPVEMCNLQTDTSGVARPAARETKMEGSVAVPMILGEELYGTLGIAKPVPYDFTEKEIEELLLIGETVSHALHSSRKGI